MEFEIYFFNKNELWGVFRNKVGTFHLNQYMLTYTTIETANT